MPIMVSAMQKHSATADLRRRREHLSEMATRGTHHEKSIAEEKLLRLDAKYDFSPPEEELADDIFAGWDIPAPSQKSCEVLKVKSEWLDVANLIKWMFQDKFQTSSSWRGSPSGSQLMLQARQEDVKRLKPFAKNLQETIVAACEVFSCGRNIRELERAPFLKGIYDGLVDEPRPVGTMMPGFSPVAKKKPLRVRKLKKSEPESGSAAAIHPYDLGREAGKKIRINIPRDQLCEEIRLALAGREE